VLAGLLPYSPPKLPADLNAGFETSYTKKDESVSSPVDTIIQAGKAAAVDWSKVGLCTYRNNLNKILLTPLAQDKEWAVDVCFWGGTLFFDINKAGRQEYDNQEKMTYYGEACTILFTNGDALQQRPVTPSDSCTNKQHSALTPFVIVVMRVHLAVPGALHMPASTATQSAYLTTQLMFVLSLDRAGLLLVVSASCSGYKFEALCTGAWQHHAGSAAVES
jgi:hypothetical protein